MNSEYYNELIRQRYQAAFQQLANSSIEEVRRISIQTSVSMVSGEISRFVDGQGSTMGSTMVDFGLMQLADNQYGPAIKLHGERVLFEPVDRLAAELIRSMSLAESYSDGRYDERLVPQYRVAAELERHWYLTDSAEPSLADISIIPVSRRVEQILGEERVLTDYGYPDWVAATWALGKGQSFNERHNLKLLRESVPHFLVTRAVQGPSFGKADSAMKPLLQAKTADERAEIVAHALVGLSLLSGPQGRYN